MINYAESLKKIASLALAAFLCAVLLKTIAVVISSGTGKGSGFDEAVALLFHYPQSLRAIFAFFAAVIFLWCLPVLFYPADIVELLRKWVVVPALCIVEHMLSLAVGVLVAWLVVDLVSGDEKLTIEIVFKVILISFTMGFLAFACSFLAIFTDTEFHKLAGAMRKEVRLLLFVTVAGVLMWAVFMDFVWYYKPNLGAGH